jgi:hypothetical protein
VALELEEENKARSVAIKIMVCVANEEQVDFMSLRLVVS